MKTFTCPVCNHPKLKPQGLSAHIRTQHPEHWAKYRTQAAPPEVKIPAVKSIEDEVHAVFAATQVQPQPQLHLTPFEHIESAISNLRTRLAEIKLDIQRIEQLQIDASNIERQLAALEKAQEVFIPLQASTAATEDTRPENKVIATAPVIVLPAPGSPQSIAKSEVPESVAGANSTVRKQQKSMSASSSSN